MDLVQHARDLYLTGRMHDALEAAQAACDRAPKDPEAWRLLGHISRHTGMPAASDQAFRRASQLNDSLTLPHRVSGERFLALVEEARAGVAATTIVAVVRVQAMPTADQVRSGVDPDALTLRDGASLVVFQVNHENRCASEDALRELLARSMTHA